MLDVPERTRPRRREPRACSRGCSSLRAQAHQGEGVPELPEKTEQVLYCEMSGTEERELYNDLRDHYRAALTGQIEKEGLGQLQDARARGPAQATARPRATRVSSIPTRRPRPARSSGCYSNQVLRGHPRGPQGARVLAVHEPARSRPRGLRPEPDHLRVSRRPDGRSQEPRSSGSRPIRKSRFSSSASRREAPASTSRPPITSSSSTRGGTRPSRPRPSAALIAWDRRRKCSPTA